MYKLKSSDLDTKIPRKIEIFIWLNTILNLRSVGKNSEEIHHHYQGFLSLV